MIADAVACKEDIANESKSIALKLAELESLRCPASLPPLKRASSFSLSVEVEGALELDRTIDLSGKLLIDDILNDFYRRALSL